MPAIRAMAKELGRDQGLAEGLWASGIHEARILASLVADPKATTRSLMDSWVEDFDSWDVCDQVCANLFCRTSSAHDAVPAWTSREEEYVRRAGFVMIATLAVHDRRAGDEAFLVFLPLIEKGSEDDRNYVKKAVNWALRQVGKRNMALNREAVRAANRIARRPHASARWIAADAIRELESKAVRDRIMARGSRGG